MKIKREMLEAYVIKHMVADRAKIFKNLEEDVLDLEDVFNMCMDRHEYRQAFYIVCYSWIVYCDLDFVTNLKNLIDPKLAQDWALCKIEDHTGTSRVIVSSKFEMLVEREAKLSASLTDIVFGRNK